MPVISGKTEWASTIVILLQLAAWCAVGITLIQKGMTSLKDKSTMATQESSIKETPLELGSVSSQGETLVNAETGVWDEEAWRNDRSQNMLHEREPRNPGREEESEESESNVSQKHQDEPQRGGIKKRTNDSTFLNDGISRKTINREEDATESTENFKTTENGQLNDTDVAFERTKAMTSDNEEYPARVSAFDVNADDADATVARKNNKVVGGAAIAVAMLSVGAIMLLLGPAVVILRALDERRQRRRFLKLATTHDLPPSYEQATLMDEVPRYSTLRLNNT